jgi:phospholipid/cholesterol/gamma-HCH transport system permease protein
MAILKGVHEAPAGGLHGRGNTSMSVALTGEPLLRSLAQGDYLRLAAVGSWTAQHASDLELQVDSAVAQGNSVNRVDLDLAGVDNIDTFGAWLLERLLRGFAEADRRITIVGMPDRFRGLIKEAHQSNQAVPEDAHEDVLASAFALLWRAFSLMTRDVLLNVEMFGALVLAILRVLIRPGSFRLTSMVHHLDRVCWRAVPIILLITVLIGAIIAQQGIFHFRRFGAEVYVVDMLGILVMREIGVLIVAIMIAGRSGSSYTAELGSMKMREEVDALQTMGLDPIEVLILPRVVALVIALPILTFLGSMAALYGGGMVCWLYAGMSPDIFMARLREIISINHFEVGMSKAPFMALVIGIVASVEGLQVKGSAESLGLQTTASVVKAIFLVIVLDGVFAIFFAAIGK